MQCLFICVRALFQAPLVNRLQGKRPATAEQNRKSAAKVILEIVILAMIAAFLGLRLYSVLGQRAEHEEEPVPTRFEKTADKLREKQGDKAKQAPAPTPLRALDEPQFPGLSPAIERQLRTIAAADRSFDLVPFLQGAKSAYAMILEAFWQGDRDTLKDLTDAEVYAGFDAAITSRDEAGEVMQNKLIRIEEANIHSADLENGEARIAVRFVSDIAAVTRDKDDNVIAGSLDDAIESVDVWTFARDTRSASPEWTLVETDEG